MPSHRTGRRAGNWVCVCVRVCAHCEQQHACACTQTHGHTRTHTHLKLGGELSGTRILAQRSAHSSEVMWPHGLKTTVGSSEHMEGSLYVCV